MNKQSEEKDNKIAEQCKYIFKELGGRSIEGKFSGGEISSDGGGVLLSLVEEKFNIVKRFAECFTDYRDDSYTEHSVYELAAERIFGIILGYEDLNDFDELDKDTLLAILAGKEDPTGSDRRHEEDKGKALASSSTLNRLELTPADASRENRYKKVVADFEEINELFLEYYFETVEEKPEEMVLDVDPTDDRVHGDQEGKFFHGYYGCYCYLPLYIFCGNHLLSAKLLEADAHLPSSLIGQLRWMIPMIREIWPEVDIVIRGDCAFQNDELMTFCERSNIDYIFGIAKNGRLDAHIQRERKDAEKKYKRLQEREEDSTDDEEIKKYKNINYRTKDSWSRARRVVTKVEHNKHGTNARFVVTSLDKEKYDAGTLYKDGYCPRGEMENRIKELQLSLFSGRTSSKKKRANQFRLFISSVGYVIVNALRIYGLKFTRFAKAQCATIRGKLFKIGVSITVRIRRVFLQWSSSYPYKETFYKIYKNLGGRFPT